MRLVLFAAVLLVLGCHVSRRGACGAVPGYLDFDNLPDTNFSCEGKVIGGYYADVETGCQMFHVCTIGQKGEITDIKFLCLNGTVFDQETRVCERVDEVDCSKTEGFYGLNLELYGNTGATYGLEEPEEVEDHEESQSHHSQTQTSSPTPPTSPSPTTLKNTSPTTPTTVITTISPPPSPTTPPHPFTPPTTISTISSTLHSFSQKPHTVHFSTTSSPHSVSSSFLTFPSGGDHLYDTGPEGSGSHSPDLDHFPPPSSSSSSWPQVNLQSGGGSGIIHQTDSSPFHALKTTPKPVNLFGTSSHNNDHSNHQFIFSTTKAPSHFFSGKSPGGFSVTSHPPVTQFPLKNPGHLIQTNIPPDFYHEQQNRNRQAQKNSQNYLGHQSNVQIVPNPIHFQYSSRPTHQHQVFTTPSVQSTVVSSTSSVSSVKTTTKHQDNHHNTQNPPANVNSFAFGINSGLSPTTFAEDKSTHNDTKHLATPPTSYDEYHERDVALDPFFKDVPRISLKQGRSNRRKRQTQDDIQRTRGSRRFRNQPASQQTTQLEQNHNITTNRRQSQRLTTRKQNIVTTTPRLNIDSSQEPNSHVPTTEISRRLPSRRKSSFNTQVPRTSQIRDSTIQESQVQETDLNDYRNNQKQINNIKPTAGEQPPPETTSELPTTTRQPLPETSFTCDGKVVGGYYADPETDCQLFHICVLGRHAKIRDDKFLCGPGTRFDQKSRTCQTKHLVNCNLATSLYNVNLPYLFPEDNEPVPDLMFESHKVSKRATKKGASHLERDEEGAHDNPPETDFSCADKSEEGLYADIETNCKYFHLCQKSKNGHLHLVSTHACPPGTSFNQQEGNCDVSKEIDCEIYSQPQHSFARSKPRNTRSAPTDILSTEVRKQSPLFANRHKRNANVDSPNTNFSCDDKPDEGLYADTETNCKYFHLCQKHKNGHQHLVSTFACPPGTSFNQQEGNCDASKEIDCEIYSQPQHSFARSQFRKKRNALEELSNKGAKHTLQHLINRHKDSSLDNPPETDFNCEDKPQEGLYADTETNCKYFHLCQKSKNGLHLASTFVCPPGTAFNQHESNCDASEEIDCEIYSQPEHSFSRSKSRNRRDLMKDHPTIGNQDSTEIYDTDDEIQSAEKDDQSGVSYENISDDESYDFSTEDTHIEETDISQEDDNSQKNGRDHGNKKSAAYPIENSDEISHESRELEISEDKDTETQSLENSKIKSEEKEEYDNESKETSEEISNSQESHEIVESKESVSDENATLQSTANLTDHTETKNTESGLDNPSLGTKTKKVDKQESGERDSEEKNSEKDISKNKKSQNNSNDSVDRLESKSSEESISNEPFDKRLKSEHNQKIENSAKDIDTAVNEQADEISTENLNEFNSSTEYSKDDPNTNEKLSVKDSRTGVKENSKPIAHDNNDSSTEDIVQYKNDNISYSEDRQEDKSKTSLQRKESGNTFKTKVNQLLMKLNASVEDVEGNTTNDDYYDYYTYDESLLELEELKEKILSTDNSAKNKQNNSSEESKISEVEEFREKILAEEIPELTTRQNSTKLSKQDSEKSESLYKNEKSSGTTTSVTRSDEYERSSSVMESDIPKASERSKSSKDDDHLIMTTFNLKNDKMINKGLRKSNHTLDTANASGTDILDKSVAFDKYEISTEHQDKKTDYSEVTSEQQYLITKIPVTTTSSEQVKEEMTKENYNETSTTIPIDTSVESITNIPKKDVPFEDANEDIDTTTEILITTLSPDTNTQTTTVSTTTSNLLHPYKSRPVYRTWRTTVPPPPVSIRPNSSLRLPRPNIRRGSTKGTQSIGSDVVNNEGEERTRPHNEHTNQLLSQEKPQEVKSKYISKGSFKDKSVETVHKPSTDKVSFPSVTTMTQQQSDVPMNVTLAENSTTKITQDPQKGHSDSESENSDKTMSYTSLEDYRTVDYDGVTPSSVLPTFSRKQFFIGKEDQEITKAGISITSTTPTSTTVLQAISEILSSTEVPIEQTYSFTSVEAQTPQSLDDVYKDTKSKTFTCSGKELHQYHPDPFDCHLFHYCSPGFHSRQLLDFRFMCDKGTAFSPVTHHCENEDETLCGNLHN